ncbi:hypothetical protein Angca_003239, partial [Angiostrongylus cantonensis]
LSMLWMFFCIFIFTKMEEWAYAPSLYFKLIPFITVGFGDVLPPECYYTAVAGFLFLTKLLSVSTAFTLVQQQIGGL